jgi:hypothetical protein
MVPRRKSGKRLPFDERARRRADEILSKRMINDPNLELAYANKWLGMDIQPTPQVDEVEERRRALEKRKLENEDFWAQQRQQLLTGNLTGMQDDPEIQEVAKQMIIAKMMEGVKIPSRAPRDGEYEGYPDDGPYNSGAFDPSNPTEVMARANELEDMVEERRARHGGGGIMASLATPEVMGALANIISRFIAPPQAQPQLQGANPYQYLHAPASQQQPTFVVETDDGKVYRMTEDEFRAHRAAKARTSAPPSDLPVTDSSIGVVPPSAPPPVTQDASPEQPQQEEVSPQEGIMLQVIKQMIPQFQPLYQEVLEASQAPATQYFQYFLNQASSGVSVYPAIYNYFMEHTYEELLRMVTPYRNDPDLRPYIEMLEKKSSWVIELISLVQDREEENDPDTGGIR